MSQVAQRLAEMTGCKLVDGFKTRVFDEEILVVIIDCGGSQRFFIVFFKAFFGAIVIMSVVVRLIFFVTVHACKFSAILTSF